MRYAQMMIMAVAMLVTFATGYVTRDLSVMAAGLCLAPIALAYGWMGTKGL